MKIFLNYFYKQADRGPKPVAPWGGRAAALPLPLVLASWSSVVSAWSLKLPGSAVASATPLEPGFVCLADFEAHSARGQDSV